MRVLGFVLFIAACSSTPPSPAVVANVVLVDAGPNPWLSLDGGVDACSAMCSNLFALGCAEGIDPDCASVCRHVQAEHLISLPVEQLTTATSKSAARALGMVCP